MNGVNGRSTFVGCSLFVHPRASTKHVSPKNIPYKISVI